ncbi:AraC family transcriptional regulator [Desulfosporosinus meridiei]|uniref:HTH araC/xylS-type domain-containing protein n=1 Tax=Desulfosporosinus meridiei (strain ATCC BAA-275 / DSM 13257 / KCTC 12902 / NCIMB 13706 / S10) TaxID=768704 RepID=J7J1B7_DESMD|nr:AraC family transcriptional regulator [Desulfosporosinus meridiei]AFQ45113.1 hypothetical protein Desmer_3233 [Desulfosporosinus meridiei DSM 13257]
MNQVEAIRAVQKMQDYIENHIYEEITLKQLSNAAGYSSWHSAIFKETTGRTPFHFQRMYHML